MGKAYFLHTRGDGTRQISWRVWVLVWVLPVCMIGGGLIELLLQTYHLSQGVRVTGTVERVYEWDNDIPWIFSDEPKTYSPVFQYSLPDGREAGASSHMSDPSLDFEVGSAHEIIVFPDQDRDVMVPGPHVHAAGWIVLYLGFALCVPAVLASLLFWRWKARGAG
ncbi:hypothetical protein ACN2XU_04640 [Primorskyibacter sp. 2E107]|uniref:hypothetical protein n=1 Tax=Primorskyibacter sp. 2E107 TaxID=3403458 RepID=UPI003AF817D8